VGDRSLFLIGKPLILAGYIDWFELHKMLRSSNYFVKPVA